MHGRLPVEPAPDDYAEARRLLAPVFNAILAHTPSSTGYTHDHDEELEYAARHPDPARRKAASPTKALANTQPERRGVLAVAPKRPPEIPPRPRRARDAAYWDET